MLLAALSLLLQGPPDLSADFEVPKGLEVTLWAETPQLYNPTAIDVDPLGRVWVTEAVNYRLWNNAQAQGRPEGDRVFVSCSPSIFVYQDRDGDGDAMDPG